MTHVLKRLAALLLVAGLAASTTACGGRTLIVNGIEVYESHWVQTTQELSARASFDLGCNDGLQFTLFRKLGRYPVEVGVSGCGQRVMYIRPNVGGYMSNSWVLSSGGLAAR